MLTKQISPHGNWAHLIFAVLIVLLFPYALFGKNKRTARCIALLNGVQISLACIFMEPYFLVVNPFFGLYAVSPIWKKTNATKTS